MNGSNPASESHPIIEWHPIRQLLGYPGHEFTLIVLHQPIQDPCLFQDLWSIAKTKIAADGGANQIHDVAKRLSSKTKDGNELFKDLDLIIGDLDSLAAETRAYFAPRTRVVLEADQFSTDFDKAVRRARREAPGRDLVCLGGLGGRVDQGLAQLHGLYRAQRSPAYADGRVYLVSGSSLSFMLKGGGGGGGIQHRIRVREPPPPPPPRMVEEGEGEGGGGVVVGVRTFARLSADPFAKHAGILPVGAPAVITLKGFEWDVDDWPTSFGTQVSTSNHVLPESEVVEVRADQDVLFTIALKQADGSGV